MESMILDSALKFKNRLTYKLMKGQLHYIIYLFVSLYTFIKTINIECLLCVRLNIGMWK